MSKVRRNGCVSLAMWSNHWSKSSKYKKINELQLQYEMESAWSSVESYGVNDSSKPQSTPNRLQEALESEETKNKALTSFALAKEAYTTLSWFPRWSS
jgi:hypothetical protein